jgi:hypothetical protein
MGILIFLLSFGLAQEAAIADTNTLPRGVRAFVYKHVRAAVPSSYSNSGALQDFSLRETLGPSVIKSIGPDVASAYEELHKIDANLAENINLGQIDMEPEIRVQANAFGLAWGLSDRLMIAVGLPIMQADVRIQGGYFNSGAVKNAASGLRSISNPLVQQKAKAMAQVLEQLPTIRGEHLQGVLTGEFGYKPIGHWSGNGIGDTQLFLQAKTFDGDRYDNGAKLGVELPTGRRDDPDNLVDIPFGTGYLGAFLESAHDLQLLADRLMLSAWARYNYTFPTERNFRLSPSRSFPLTSQKETIRYNPGNSYVLGAEISTKISRSFGLSTAVYSKTKSVDSIRGARSEYDYSILEYKSDSRSNTAEATLSFTTIDYFLRKKFPVPFKVGITASRVFSGKNTERIDQGSLNFDMYF